ncbi:type VI secretion system baseplate subunit TssF [Pseudomonas sp. TE3610]
MDKDNLTLRYFQAEMRYLREAGKEFAAAYPELAAELNLDRPGARDPYVERLLEGFAFLMGRVREKIDDDLPELTEGLVSLLWPHYLRTIPSLCVVELAPEIDRMKQSHVVDKGFEILSRPLGPRDTRCRYTTTQAVPLRPLRLDALRLSHGFDGRALLQIRLSRGAQMPWGQFDLAQIALYLDGDERLTATLHRALTLGVQAIHARVPEQPGRQPLDAFFSPKGFCPQDRLWPKGDSAFSGYQLLLEYFTFPQKFSFVTLCGLEQVQVPAQAPWLELDIELDSPWPREHNLSLSNLKLHAVPVINLFALESDPLALDPLQSDYLLRALRLQDGHTEIYSVDGVTGTGKSGHHTYVPFTSFQHKGGLLRDDAPERYFHTRLKRGANGLHDTWLILGGEGFDQDRLGAEEHLSLRLTGTHGMLPHKALQSALLDTPAQAGPVPLQVRSLCAPTSPCYPPSGDRFHWRILSHLGSTFLPMLDNAEVLRGTLALYDWTASDANRRRLRAITEVRHHLIQRFEKGCLLRGVDIEVTLETSGFRGEGDISLFGEMLSRFFALYADIHLFNQLTLILHPGNRCLRWGENHSQRVPG